MCWHKQPVSIMHQQLFCKAVLALAAVTIIAYVRLFMCWYFCPGSLLFCFLLSFFYFKFLFFIDMPEGVCVQNTCWCKFMSFFILMSWFPSIECNVILRIFMLQSSYSHLSLLPLSLLQELAHQQTLSSSGWLSCSNYVSENVHENS